MEHTEKLFYAQPPVLEFTARVLACEEDKKGWQVVLDRTAFYPEGGGQPAENQSKKSLSSTKKMSLPG